jgi:BlaI family transcriptional regulator, penicillinase repressor
MPNPDPLSRRERQLVNLLYRLTPASAPELHAEMANPPSYSAVRAHLATLVNKGHIQRELIGGKHEYSPTIDRESAGLEALQRVVDSFYGGSSSRAIEALRTANRDWAQW